jgi:tripartite-type tricarboxylate transporter receptor subunit TctC
LRAATSALAFGVCALLAPLVVAQDAYPSRPIRIIVPFPAGGGTDTVTRIIAQKMAENWKQPVVVENRAGANTIIGAEAAAKSAPDGYTLFAAIDSTLCMNPSLYAKLPYDPVKDFTPITLATSYPMVLEAAPSYPARNLAELIATLKSGGNKLSIAYPAVPAQVAGELFKSVVGVPDLVGVMYKGGAPAVQDVMGGQVPLLMDALGPSLPHVRSGKLKAYAVTSRQRSAALPDVPTFAESGFPGMEMTTWIGYLGPAGLRPEIVARLNAEFVRVLALPDVRERLVGLGIDIHASSPAEFAQTIQSDAAKFDRVIKAAGIKVE